MAGKSRACEGRLSGSFTWTLYTTDLELRAPFFSVVVSLSTLPSPCFLSPQTTTERPKHRSPVNSPSVQWFRKTDQAAEDELEPRHSTVVSTRLEGLLGVSSLSMWRQVSPTKFMLKNYAVELQTGRQNPMHVFLNKSTMLC